MKTPIRQRLTSRNLVRRYESWQHIYCNCEAPELSGVWSRLIGPTADNGARHTTLAFSELSERLRPSMRQNASSQSLTNDHLRFGRDHCARRARRHPNNALIQEYFHDKRGTSNCRAIARVLSVKPSSTIMIPFRSHVCAIADRSVSAINSCELKAGIRIGAKAFHDILTILRTLSGSTPRPYPTNDGRSRNPVSPHAAVATLCRDYSGSKSRASRPSRPDQPAYIENQSCLQPFPP